MASICTLPPFCFDDLPWHHPLTPPRPLRGWACRRHCWPPPLPRSHPLCRPGRCGCRQRRGMPAPPASQIGSGAVPPVPAWVQRGLHRPHRRGCAAATGVSLLLPLACTKGRAREVGGGVCLPLLCYVFILFELHHKQHYYWTASFSFSQSHIPPFIMFTIWRRDYLRYKDLCHCTFPLVIQGLLSLYDYIGILYDTIYPHTPTSSTIHIGLAYVGLDCSSI